MSNKKGKEPISAVRAVNLALGFIILSLVLVITSKDSGTEIYEMIVFALAAIENFIAATVGFSEKKKVRGNIYAVIGALFLIIALVLAVQYFGVL